MTICEHRRMYTSLLVSSVLAGKTLSKQKDDWSAMLEMVFVSCSIHQFLLWAVSEWGFGLMLTVIVPVYGSARKDGVEGRLPMEDPGLDRDMGIVLGDWGLPLAETGLFKSEKLDLLDNWDRLRAGGPPESEELGRIGKGPFLVFWQV